MLSPHQQQKESLFSSARRCLVLFFSDGFIPHRAVEEENREIHNRLQDYRSVGIRLQLEFSFSENRKENNERFKVHMKTT